MDFLHQIVLLGGLVEMVLFLVIYILICELLRRKVAWPKKHPVLTYLLVLLILGSSW